MSQAILKRLSVCCVIGRFSRIRQTVKVFKTFTVCQVCYLVIIVFLLVGCNAGNLEVEPVPTRLIIPESDVLAFLEKLEISHYHDLKRLGTETFKSGYYLPDYQSMLDGYPAQELPEGQIRYDLFLIEGEAGTAWIYLFLDKKSGQIIEFSAGDATF